MTTTEFATTTANGPRDAIFSKPIAGRGLAVGDFDNDGSVDLLAKQDTLNGEDVLPAFSCSLRDLW